MKNYKTICADCACLIEKGKQWCCDEMWGKPCEELEECPEGIESEEVTEILEKTKGKKIDCGITSKAKNEKKPKTVKVSDEKTQIFNDICDFLTDKYDFSIEKPNKLVIIDINGKKIKLDFVETRQKKA